MKLQKMTAVFVSIVLALGLCPLPAYAAVGDLAAGAPSSGDFASVRDSYAMGADTDDASADGESGLAPAELVAQSGPSDAEGRYGFPVGDEFAYSGENSLKYWCKVVASPDLEGNGAKVAVTGVSDTSADRASDEYFGTVECAIPEQFTYTYQDNKGDEYSQAFTVSQIGADGSYLWFADTIGTVTIPKTVDEVYRLGSSRYLTRIAFAAGSTIVEIPDDFLAYAEASRLASVVLPDTVERIGDNAFFNCYRLSDANMPASLTAIGDKAFYNTSLSAFELPSGLETIGRGAFAWSARDGYSGPTYTSVEIPASVTVIGDYAFASANSSSGNQLGYARGATQLTALTFAVGSRLTRIGDYAFAGSSIEMLVLPASLKMLGADATGASHAFYDCDALKSVAWAETDENPSQLEVLGGFGDCDALETVYLPSTSVREVAPEAFIGCDSLQTVRPAASSSVAGLTLPASVEAIGVEAFFNCDALASAAIPGGVTEVGERAFCACDNLATVTIEQGVETIGAEAFQSCDKLGTVTLGQGLKTIGDGAFSACPALKAIEIPASVSLIGKYSFTPNSTLGTYYPPTSAVGLESLTIKPGFTDLTIDDGAFLGCVGLGGARYDKSTIVLPERVSKIGGGAFMYINNAIFEIHNPSVVFTSGAGYLSAELSIDDARVFNDDEPDEDGLCYAQIPDPWQTDDWANYKNLSVLNDVRDDGVSLYEDYTAVRYPDTVTRGTSPTFAIYLDQVNLLENGREYRPKFEPVDPATFAPEEMDEDEGVVEVAERGRLRVRTTGDAGSNAIVCVYDSEGDLVASDQAGRGLAIIEGLAAGTYTVTAFAKNANFSAVDSLDGYEALGLSTSDYARKNGVVIQEGKDTVREESNALSVPKLYAAATVTASDYIVSSTLAVSKKDIFKDVQFFATFNYKMKGGNKKAHRLILKVPQGMSLTSVASANRTYLTGETADRTVPIDLEGADMNGGRLFIGMKAKKTGTFTLNASLACGDGTTAGPTFPVGNATVACSALSLELPEGTVPAKVNRESETDSLGQVTWKETLSVDPFTVGVYAAPNTEVTVRCGGTEQTVTTNRGGHAEATVTLAKLETALTYTYVSASVQDDGVEVSAQGAVQFAAEQRDPYTLKDFSFVHAGKKYDIVKDARPRSRSSYYTYIANGKEANKYWSFEAVYITDSPLWVGGRASAVMQTASCTLQVQMLDGSSRYEKMTLLGSEEQDDGTYLNTFAATLYLDQAGDHVFPTSLIPAAFGVSLYAPESTAKKLTQPDIDGMRNGLHELNDAWKVRVDTERKDVMKKKYPSTYDDAGNVIDSAISDPDSLLGGLTVTDLLDQDFSSLLFYERTRVWEFYEDALENPSAYGLDSTDQALLSELMSGCDQAADMLGKLYDGILDAETSISDCGSFPEWVEKNTDYTPDAQWTDTTASQLEKAGWNVVDDANAVNVTGNGGTPTNGLTGSTYKEPSAFATKTNKDSDGNVKSMSYRDSNGNSATLKVPAKYDVSMFDQNDAATLIGSAFNWDNVKNGRLPRLDMKIEEALRNKLNIDEATFQKRYGSFNLSKYGVGFSYLLQLGTTVADGYEQWQNSKELIEVFKDADRARDYADNLTIRVNKMIKSGEWKKNSKCFKALKNERDWAIIVADGLKGHAQFSELEAWRKFGMSGGSALAGATSGPLGSTFMYGADKWSGKMVANEMNSNMSVLTPAQRNLAAAHLQRLIDCGEKDDDPPFNMPAILDPSGVVYEAWPGNPLEGVTATVYEAEKSGDVITSWSKWDAEAYDQKNDQVTAADGAFSWDVPVGTWKVGFVKDGYADAETAAMEVPPPRMGLTVGMVADADPAVKSVTADTKSIEVAFNQYMDASELPSVSVNGVAANGAEWVDVAEWDDDDDAATPAKMFSKMLRIPVPANTKLGDALNVSVGDTANYAGKGLASQQFDGVEVKARPTTIQFNFPDTISMPVGADRPTTVRVFDGEGNPMQGLKLTAALDNDVFATVDASEATTDAGGAAKLKVAALLPGMSELTVGIEGEQLARTVNLLTTADANQAARPVAVVGSTTYGPGAAATNEITVQKGTQLQLSCTTQDAVIYYTTDGSCPCQNTPGRKTYTGPITINESTNFIIASYKDGLDYSEKLKLNVTVKAADPTPDPQPDPTPVVKKASTISLAAQSSTYTGKAIAYKGKVTRTGSTGKVTYAYYKDAKCTKGVAASNVKAAGTYYVRATVAADTNYKAATSKAVKLTINRAANPMKVSGKSPTVKYSKVKKKAVTIKKANAFTIKKAVGSVTFAKAKGNKKITVAKKTGKVKVAKGLKKGTYKVKVKVTAKGNANYKKATKTATVKVVVKK